MKQLIFTKLGILCLLSIGCGGVDPEPIEEQLATASLAITERDLPGCELPNNVMEIVEVAEIEILKHPLDPVLKVLQMRGNATCIDTNEAIIRYIKSLTLTGSKHAASYIAAPVEDDPHPLTRGPSNTQAMTPEDDPHPLTNSNHPTVHPNPVENSTPEDDPHPLTHTTRPSSSDDDEVVYQRPYTGIH